jgi:hypothetical protein
VTAVRHQTVESARVPGDRRQQTVQTVTAVRHQTPILGVDGQVMKEIPQIGGLP